MALRPAAGLGDSAGGPPHYCTPPWTVPDVLEGQLRGGLTIKKKFGSATVRGSFWVGNGPGQFLGPK